MLTCFSDSIKFWCRLSLLHLSLFLGVYAFYKRFIFCLSFYNEFGEEAKKLNPAFNSLLVYINSPIHSSITPVWTVASSPASSCTTFSFTPFTLTLMIFLEPTKVFPVFRSFAFSVTLPGPSSLYLMSLNLHLFFTSLRESTPDTLTYKYCYPCFSLMEHNSFPLLHLCFMVIFICLFI